MSTNLIKVMDILENSLNCAGICKPGLFWMFRPIKEGQPPNGCAVALKIKFDKTIGTLAWGLLATAIITAFTLLCSCGLCRIKKTTSRIEFDNFGGDDDRMPEFIPV